MKYKYGNPAKTCVYALLTNELIYKDEAGWDDVILAIEDGLVEEPITEFESKLVEINQALVFLKNTDWMVLREIERGIPIPVDIKLKRTECILLSDGVSAYYKKIDPLF